MRVQCASSGVLAVAGDIVTDDASGALDSSGQSFAWAVDGPSSSQAGPNGTMTQLSWG